MTCVAVLTADRGSHSANATALAAQIRSMMMTVCNPARGRWREKNIVIAGEPV